MPDFLSIQPVPSRSSAAPAQTGYAGPLFADVLKALSGDGFEMGAPMEDPAYKTAVERIRSNADFYGKKAVSEAQALAGRRGLAGSSAEQFGTQTALDNVNRAAADEEAKLMLHDLERRRLLSSEAAKYTSDEITSLRNAFSNDQLLELQRILGERGIDVAEKNIDATREINRKNSQLGLIGQIGSMLLPNLLFGSGGGGTGGGFKGILSRLFPGKAGAPTAETADIAPGAAGGVAGALKTALPPVAGAAAATALWNADVMNARGKGLHKDTAKALAILPGTATATAVIKNAVSKAFGGGGTATKGLAEASRAIQSQLQALRDLRAARDAGQITPQQYEEAALPIVTSAHQNVNAAASRGSDWASGINPTWKAFQDEGFVKADPGRAWLFETGTPFWTA